MPIFVRFAANGLAFTSVLLLVLTLPATAYLFLRPNKRRATWWLATFMVCIDLALITMLIVNSVVLFGAALNPLQDVFICLGGVAIVRFAYNFPQLTRPRAANAVTTFLAGMTAIGLIYAITYAARYLAPAADLQNDFPPIAPLFYLLMPLVIATVTAVFVARALETARATSARGEALPGWHGALSALASPPNPVSKAHRNFALAVSLGTVQAGASYAAAFTNTPLAMAAISLGALVALAAILLVYLNNAPEPQSLVVRLMGITLVCLLGVLTLVGQISINIQAHNLGVYNVAFLRIFANYDAARDEGGLDPNVLLIQSWNADAVRAGKPGIGVAKFVSEEAADRGIAAELKPPPWPAEEQAATWVLSRPLILQGQPPRLTYVYYIEERGQLIAVVVAGQFYVRAVHQLNRGLIMATLVGAGVLALLVTMLVRSGMIAPLQRLMTGIRRADRGDLTTPVPVLHDDEIGYVTRSFNRLIASMSAAQQALIEAYERQEAVVAQRTAQLAAALDTAEEAKRDAEQSEQKARAANEAKSIFLANVSHELRTPLTMIVGYPDLLGLENELTDDQRTAVRSIQRSADYLLELVDDVLELRKLETSQVELQNVPFKPALLAAQMEEMFRHHARAKGLTLSVTVVSSTDTEVIADQRKVRRIAVNLISNAIKFTDEGSVRVTIHTVQPTAAPETDGTVQFSGRLLVLTVQDTGQGIPPESAEAIWQPFQRIHPGAATPGVGLGLPLSRDLARFLGGDLTMQSTGKPGEGATFRLEIPVEPALPSEPAAAPLCSDTQETLLARNARVLVVDDFADNRKLLQRILDSYDIEVQCAASGSEAVRICMAWHPHLVFMDIRMPEMDGFSATQRIHELCATIYPEGGGPKIVALTAHAFEEERRKLLQAGFHDLVRKPYRRQDIAAALVRHLGVVLPAAEPARAGTDVGPSRAAADRAAAPALPPGESDLAQRLARLIHDVRNALTTIGLWAEMALDSDGDGDAAPGAYREYLERIERKSRAIGELLNVADAQIKHDAGNSTP